MKHGRLRRWRSALWRSASPALATPRRRATAAGASVVLVGLAVLYVAGAFGPAPELGRMPAASPTASEPSDPADMPELEPDLAFEMSATASDAIGVEPGTEFLLTSTDDLPTDAIGALLHVDPAIDVGVEREGEGRYRITPLEPLVAGEVYRLRMEDATAATPHVLASFAFQAKAPVGVLQTIPGNRESGVPTNTGIELTFAQDGIQDLEGHFRIEPEVPGRFETHGRVSVFVPADGLAPRTLYTVTVTRGLSVAGSDDVMAEDFVLQFETSEEERDGGEPQQRVSFSRLLAESATANAPVLETYVSLDEPVRLSVEVHGFDGREAFLASLEEYQRLPAWASRSREWFLTDTTNLSRVATFEADVQRQPESDRSFVAFPSPLPTGFYVVQSAFADQPMQAWLQVTDVATYAAFADDRALVWVNDLATQSPMVGARVELIGSGSFGETAGDGTVVLDTPTSAPAAEPADPVGGREGNLLVTAPDGRQAVVPVSPMDRSSDAFHGYHGFFGRSAAVDDYWTYLSVDRPLYQPTDTVRFWGIARPREDPGPRSVTIQLSSHEYVGYDYTPVIVGETTLETSALGTFTGELPFAALSPGSYGLTALVDGRTIGSASVSVQTYTKPAYQIAVTPDRPAAFAGETITFSVDATFLEGTPVPGLGLTYSGSAEGRLVTDQGGHASVTVTAGAGSDPNAGVTSASLWVRPVRAEEGEIVGEGSATVYPASVTASATAEPDGNQGVVSGTVHHIDLERSGQVDANGMEDLTGDPASGASVTMAISDVAYRQVETGEYYDFIAKITRKRYRYEEVVTPVGTFSVTTDASGAFRHAFAADPDRDYRIELRARDGAGRTELQHLWLSGSLSRLQFQAGNVYLSAPDSTSVGFFGGSDTVALDEQTSLSMYRGGTELPSGGVNRYLFLVAQAGIHDYAVEADSTHDFVFAEDDVPNVSISSVWFNGDTYVPVNFPYRFQFDPAERGLELEVTPDKERYEPGEEVRLELAVTDRDGVPQPDTEVNLSLVDEALYQVSGAGECACVLANLYAPVSPGILSAYASHQYPSQVRQPGLGATTGGPREQFADVAFFGSVRTDANGRASVAFDLPDNLTSWRVTAQGFNDQLMAGGATRSVAVGLPFFADVTLSDEYLVSDRPEVRVRSFGSGLAAGAEVTFSVSAPSLGIDADAPATVTAPAFQAAGLPLSGLREGEHEILIEARSGDLTDSLVRTIRVVPSRLVGAHAHYYDLESGLRVEGSGDGPTRVVLTDRERGRYFGTLQQLTWGYGDRLDQQLARDVAAELLETFYADVEARDAPFDPSAYQTPEGGVALFPYAGQDLVLSARAAAIAPDRFGAGALTRMFLRVLEDPAETRERQAIALYGLAAMGEPVLESLHALLEEPDLSWREQLYAGLGLVELGDDTNARQILQLLIETHGERVGPDARLRVAERQDDILEATSLAAILAGGLGDPRAPQLFAYTTQNATSEILLELEQISYLASALPRLSSEAVRVAVTVDGERTVVSLRRGESHALQLRPDQLATLELEPVAGNIGVASFYTAPIDPASMAIDPDVTVTRRYSVDPAALSEGDVVRITLAAEFGAAALDGCYQLTDILPSGLRPVVRTFGWGLEAADAVYPYRIDGQRVSFCVSDDAHSKVAAYWARVVSAGEYTAEPALIQSMQNAQRVSFTAPERVVIR